MTPHPDCASVDTTILDALHMMHDGKFLHLPVIDKGDLYFSNFVGSLLILTLMCCWLFILVSADGYVVACMDVLQITHAAISMVNFRFQIHKNCNLEDGNIWWMWLIIFLRCSFVCIGVCVCMCVGYLLIFSTCLGDSHASYLIAISLSNQRCT